MELLQKLRDAVHQAQKENDLPDYLAERILLMAEQPNKYADKKTEINDLIAQLALYDTYGQTGYLGMGVNNAILEKTLERLENRVQG